jgi:hypothetical protein
MAGGSVHDCAALHWVCFLLSLEELPDSFNNRRRLAVPDFGFAGDLADMGSFDEYAADMSWIPRSTVVLPCIRSVCTRYSVVMKTSLGRPSCALHCLEITLRWQYNITLR